MLGKSLVGPVECHDSEWVIVVQKESHGRVVELKISIDHVMKPLLLIVFLTLLSYLQDLKS